MIKRILVTLGLAAIASTASAGVTIYGHVNIGNVPAPPVLVYPQPVIIVAGPAVQQQPVYLHVPPGHSRNWRRHCHRYGACGQPVYFVQRGWYDRHYPVASPPPGHRSHGRHDHHGRGHGHGHGRD